MLKQFNTIQFYALFIGLLRLKKRSTEKKTPRERLPKAIDWKIYACSDMDLGEVLFHYVVFCAEESRDLPSKIYRVSFGGIS